MFECFQNCLWFTNRLACAVEMLRAKAGSFWLGSSRDPRIRSIRSRGGSCFSHFSFSRSPNQFRYLAARFAYRSADRRDPCPRSIPNFCHDPLKHHVCELPCSRTYHTYPQPYSFSASESAFHSKRTFLDSMSEELIDAVKDSPSRLHSSLPSRRMVNL
jgi:hypothetical protein